MAMEKDTRPLTEIRFAQSRQDSAVEATIREAFSRAGVRIGQDIIDLGCTGFVSRSLPAQQGEGSSREDVAAVLSLGKMVRENMDGSVCGLPCYVPRDRFCLVHDTIGGLQQIGNLDGPQACRHSEALPYMSRELNDEEAARVNLIKNKQLADARTSALRDYDACEVEETDVQADPIEEVETLSCPVPTAPFKCSEHEEPNWGCPKCLAQAVAEQKKVDTFVGADLYPSMSFFLGRDLEPELESLARGEVDVVTLWVRAAVWTKKVVRG